MSQQQNPTKHSHSDLEEFKKNWMQRIERIAKSKTEWIEDFKKVYKETKTPKRTITIEDYAKNKI